MKLTTDEITAINVIIKPLLGEKAHDVKLGVGSFITIEFGEPTSVSRGKQDFSEWYLWIYCCGWYLERPNGPFIGSEDPRDILRQEVTSLEGLRLESVNIFPVGLVTDFSFERGFVLHTFPLNFIEKCDYWKLFTPENKVLLIGSGNGWSYVKSSEPGPQ